MRARKHAFYGAVCRCGVLLRGNLEHCARCTPHLEFPLRRDSELRAHAPIVVVVVLLTLGALAQVAWRAPAEPRFVVMEAQ